MSSEERRTTAQFESVAESYFDSGIHRLGADREAFMSWRRSATRAFDMTTGADHIMGVITNASVSSVVAADATPEMVATMVRECPAAGVVADAEYLPLADNVFDAAACRIAARHFPDSKVSIAEVAHVLESGGIFAFEDNVAPGNAAPTAFLNGVEVLRGPTHVELHPASRRRKWFAAAGLSVEAVETAAIRLQSNSWAERTNVPPADRDKLGRRFREASEGAKELFDVESDGGSTVSFVNPKALIRAQTEQVSRVAASDP